ncbi:hypothetical protein FHW58_002892 [Duganella sp. 1224]|uniref:hypothetical protein n=1 Tax=Duganella sp. 1224 TaxID=2587052 RepID=UPI0015CA640E|nr:hypothetical protein [Duganella sp. 1224]NYE61685.1 hypothetical protein [Duganella sp. 1224]
MSTDKIKTLLAWLLLALSASLLRFQTVLQSDSLFLDDLFSDLLHHGGHWTEWKFASAPAFVPDMLLYWLAMPLFGEVTARIFFVSVAQVFLLASALLWCARQIHPALSKSAQASIVLLLALFTAAAGRSSMWLYFYSTNNHLAVVLFGLTGIGLMLNHLERPRAVSAALLVAGSAAALLSTQLFVLGFMLPALLLLATAWLTLGPGQALRRPLARLIGLLLLAQVLATLLGKLLIRYPAREGRIHPSPDTAGAALRNFMNAVTTAFTPDNPLTFLCALLVLLALGFLALRLLRATALRQQGLSIATGDWRFAAAAALLAVGLTINLLGVILSGGFGDPFALRYLALPIALALLLAVIRLDLSPIQRPMRALAIGAAQLALFAVVLVSAARLTLRPPPPIVDASALAAGCLAQLESAGFPLKAGIADYWNGRGVRYQLPHRNPILVTTNTLAPDFHVSTLGPVMRPRDYPEHVYNFAVLYGAAQPANPQYTAAAMRQALPAPARVASCGNGRLEIWLYQDDSLDRAVKQAGADWLRQGKR